jgi:hypothetical protein
MKLPFFKPTVNEQKSIVDQEIEVYRQQKQIIIDQTVARTIADTEKQCYMETADAEKKADQLATTAEKAAEKTKSAAELEAQKLKTATEQEILKRKTEAWAELDKARTDRFDETVKLRAEVAKLEGTRDMLAEVVKAQEINKKLLKQRDALLTERLQEIERLNKVILNMIQSQRPIQVVK